MDAGDPQYTVWNDAQQRVDALKTPRQRKARLREIRHRRTHDIATMIELGLLMDVPSRKHPGLPATARELADDIRDSIQDGSLRAGIRVDGQFTPLSPKAFRDNH